MAFNKILNVTTTVKCLNRVQGEFTGNDGKLHPVYRLNVSQDEDTILAQINVKEEIFQIAEKGVTLELYGEYRPGKNGNYISWISARPITLK